MKAERFSQLSSQEKRKRLLIWLPKCYCLPDKLMFLLIFNTFLNYLSFLSGSTFFGIYNFLLNWFRFKRNVPQSVFIGGFFNSLLILEQVDSFIWVNLHIWRELSKEIVQFLGGNSLNFNSKILWRWNVEEFLKIRKLGCLNNSPPKPIIKILSHNLRIPFFSLHFLIRRRLSLFIN